MNWKKAKTILIIMLLIADLTLLAIYYYGKYRDLSAEREYMQTVISLIGENGLIANANDIPVQNAAVIDIDLNVENERAIAEELLGAVTVIESEGFTEYESKTGIARFRGLGDFEIKFSVPLTASGDLEVWIKTIALRMGITETGNVTHESEDYSLQIYETGLPVWGAVLQFTFDKGRLVKISGKCLPGGKKITTNSFSRSAISVLLQLSKANKDAGIDSGRLIRMELGYRISAYAPNISRLTPYWKIVTTRGEYFFEG